MLCEIYNPVAELRGYVLFEQAALLNNLLSPIGRAWRT